MYDRDELALVHDDLPRVPLYGLIDFAQGLIAQGDDAELQPFRAERARDKSRTPALAPSVIIEALKPIIDREHPEQPFDWHVQRLAHRVSARLHPEPQWKARDAYKQHEVALRRLAERTPVAFLFPGLRLERREERVWAHILDWVGRDLSAVACLPSGSEDLAAVSPESLRVAARAVLAPLLEVATPDPADPTTLIVAGDGVLAGAVGWLGKLLQARPELIALIDVEPLPARVILAEDAPRTEDDDDLFTRRRKGWPFLDLRRVRLPEDADEAARVVASAVARHPQLAGALAWQIGTERKAPSAAGVRALAGASPELLAVVVERGWLDGLRDAAELVSAASALPRLQDRARALVAIGTPAGQELGALADEIIAGLSDPAHPLAGAGSTLTTIADQGAALGLPFWFKRLERPGAFPWLWGSRRIGEALALRPEPLTRVVRRAAERGDRAAGLTILRCLLSDWEEVRFSDLAPHIVALVREPTPELHWKHRLNLLALANSDEARALIVAAVEDVNDEDLAGQPLLLPLTWDGLLACEHLKGTWLLELMLGHPGTYDLGPLGACAVVDAVLDRGLERWTDRRHRAEQGAPPVANLLFHLLTEHAAALGPERLAAGRVVLGGVMPSEILVALDRRVGATSEPPRLPWAHLTDADRGFLLREIGEWLAARIADKTWEGLDFGEVLKPAILARYREVLGPSGEAILAALGDRWPTQALIAEQAGTLGIPVEARALDRCADEAVPAVLRAALARLPLTIEATDDSRYSDEHWVVRWVFEQVWAESPELLARHVLAVFEAADRPRWRRGLALALVALREPCGTGVPDALTRAMHEAIDADERAFFQRQRDAFARDRVAQQQDVPPETRTREGLARLQRYARQTRGVA